MNRSSAKIFAESKARREAERARGAQQGGAANRASDEPEFGQRVHPDTRGEEPGSSSR